MEFMTEEYVKEQAALGELASLICSALHHNQGATCTRGELIDAVDSGAFKLCNNLCACCAQFGACAECPLTTMTKGAGDDKCCDGIFKIACLSFDKFKCNPTPANFAAFQEAEKAVEDYIQAVIDKKKEPDVTYFAEGDRFKIHGFKTILAQVDVDFFALINIRSGNRWRKPIKVVDRNRVTWQELDQMCGYPTIRYYDARKQAKVRDNAKQAKVGEKAEVKDEPKLSVRNGDVFPEYHTKKLVIAIIDKDGVTHGHFEDGRNADVEKRDAKYDSGVKPILNIFSDLTETSDGFEMEQHPMQTVKVSISPTGYIHLTDLGGTICIDSDKLQEFHRKLGHVLNHIRSKNHG